MLGNQLSYLFAVVDILGVKIRNQERFHDLGPTSPEVLAFVNQRVDLLNELLLDCDSELRLYHLWDTLGILCTKCTPVWTRQYVVARSGRIQRASETSSLESFMTLLHRTELSNKIIRLFYCYILDTPSALKRVPSVLLC